MIPGPDGRRIKVQLTIFWIVWLADLLGLIGFYFLLGREGLPAAPAGLLVNLAGFGPLFVSIVIRWLILPRATGPGMSLMLFIVGLALAEACGILGLFLGGPYRESLFVLGMLGVTSYVPLFARQLLEPKGSGFIPNR
jgi:hypothetical protein